MFLGFLFLLIIIIIFSIYILSKYHKVPSESHLHTNLISNDKQSKLENIIIKIGKNNIENTFDTQNQEKIFKGNNFVQNPKPTSGQVNIENISNYIIGKFDFTNVEEMDLVYSICLQNQQNLHIDSQKLFQKNNIRLANAVPSEQANIFFQNTICGANILTNQMEFHGNILNMCRILIRSLEIPIIKRILIGQYIISKTDSNQEIYDIYDFILKISRDKNIDFNTRANAIDILNLSNSTRYMTKSKQSLDLLRTDEQKNLNKSIFGLDLGYNLELQHKILNEITVNNKTNKDVYNDTQNIHNTSINESSKKSAEELIKKYHTDKVLSLVYNTDNYSIQENSKINTSIKRILTDTSKFIPKELNSLPHEYSLYDVYNSLLNMIENNPNKEELNKRLIEELIDMSGLCATGHLSRLVIVPQGIIDGNYVKIDIEDEIYSKIKNHLDKSIQNSENADELINDLISESTREKINGFVNIQVGIITPNIIKEYENILNKEEILEKINIGTKKYIR